MADSIADGIQANAAVIGRFAEAWYASPYTFQSTRVLGHVACKVPLDLWVFHDLFCQYRFETVVETGTAAGGTTLWFATLMELLGIDGHVFSVDVASDLERPEHRRVTYVTGDSTDPALVADIAAQLRGPVLVDLDSDHFPLHVMRELECWAPCVPVGSWLVVEDTNATLSGHAYGPADALAAYLTRHPNEFLREAACERFWLTMNPGGWLQRLQVCAHHG